MNFRPLNKRVLVQRFAAEEVSAGGIILPDATHEAPIDGIVRAVHNDDPIVAVGDHVMFPKHAGSMVAIDEVAYLVITEDELWGVFDD
jgi:chaperonin GroES